MDENTSAPSDCTNEPDTNNAEDVVFKKPLLPMKRQTDDKTLTSDKSKRQHIAAECDESATSSSSNNNNSDDTNNNNNSDDTNKNNNCDETNNNNNSDDTNKNNSDDTNNNDKNNSDDTNNNNNRDTSQLDTTPRSSIGCSGYKAPNWAGEPPSGYALETLRLGAIIDKRDVGACTVFGRLADCDVVLQHPSISRYHAALVYRSQSNTSDHPTGFYLCDLNSTHGTRINKQPVQPSVYCRVRVGHMFKLGGSSRLFILQGPVEDEEAESALSVTEIKQIALERRLRQEQRVLDQEEDREDQEAGQDSPGCEEDGVRDVEKDGIDWGMGEDASESADLTYNPYATGDADNSHLYLEDPKRTLRGWFEREGYDLEYDTETVTNGKHVCRIELPVEGRGGERLVAEVQHVGKKRDAVLQCAMQACRLLDMAGLLRQATHESRAGRKRHCSGDASDDDDTFLDRTGAVEKRRQRKLATSGDGEEKEPETHQSLTVKYIALQKEITQLEDKLNTLCETENLDETGECTESDALDTYMKSLNSLTGSAAKKEQRKIKNMLSRLRADSERIHRLVQLTRPASLPPLIPPGPPVSSASSAAPASKLRPAVVVGKRKGGVYSRRTIAPASVPSPASIPGPSSTQSNTAALRLSSDSSDSSRVTTERNSAPDSVGSGIGVAEARSGHEVPGHCLEDQGPCREGTIPCLDDSRPSLEKSRPSPEAPAPALTENSNLSRTVVTPAKQRDPRATGESRSGPVCGPRQPRQPERELARQHQRDISDRQVETEGSDDSIRHSTWLPPPGQTGDGRTSLNDKLGY